VVSSLDQYSLIAQERGLRDAADRAGRGDALPRGRHQLWQRSCSQPAAHTYWTVPLAPCETLFKFLDS
jgi:hypothetical protein